MMIGGIEQAIGAAPSLASALVLGTAIDSVALTVASVLGFAWAFARPRLEERSRAFRAALAPAVSARETVGANDSESGATVLDGFEKAMRAVDDRAVLPLARLTEQALIHGRDSFVRKAGRVFVEASKHEWDGLAIILDALADPAGAEDRPIRIETRSHEIRVLNAVPGAYGPTYVPTSPKYGAPGPSLSPQPFGFRCNLDAEDALALMVEHDLAVRTDNDRRRAEITPAIRRRLRQVWPDPSAAR